MPTPFTAGVSVYSIRDNAYGTVRNQRARPATAPNDPGPWYTIDWDAGRRSVAHHDDLERVDV
jgi:hypothetical protein